MKEGPSMTNTTSQAPHPSANNSTKNLERSELTKIFESKLFWIAVVFILFSLPLTLSFRSPPVVQPPVLGQLQAFSLTNQDGKKFGTEELSGSVVLVNFIFTRCPSVCPVMTKSMSQVQERLKATAKSIQLVSITVDPENDTPEVLKKYAHSYGARHQTWNFLTGSKEEIRKIVVENFKTALEAEPSADTSDMSPAFDIAHSEHFVLIDQVGRIRAYEKVHSSSDINRLIKQFAILANSPPQT